MIVINPDRCEFPQQKAFKASETMSILVYRWSIIEERYYGAAFEQKFDTQSQAHRWHDNNRSVSDLDRDSDDVACESLH